MKEEKCQKKDCGLSFTVLASGSKGNCIHVDDGETSLLLDAGLSGKEILVRMREKGLFPEKLSAIILSHEHTDHVSAAGVLSRKLKIPVYGTQGTLEGAKPKTGEIALAREITAGLPFALGSVLIHPFSISHDAADPTGFTFCAHGVKLGIATDLGVATTLVKTHLKNCNALVLEANHCPVMLANGSYPWALKQRVKSRTGHLSNEAARDLLGELLHKDLSHVVVAHLSEENNRPDHACTIVGEALRRERTKLFAAGQNEAMSVIRLSAR